MRNNEQRSDEPCADEARVFTELPGPAAKRFRYNLAATIRADLRPGDLFSKDLHPFNPINSRLRLSDVIEVVGSNWTVEVSVVGPSVRRNLYEPVTVAPRDGNWHSDDVSPDSEIARLTAIQREIERAVFDMDGGPWKPKP